MSADVHITRAEEYWDSEEAPIPASEWERYVDDAADLVRQDGQRMWSDSETDDVVWTGHPDSTFQAWLAHTEGRIFTSNPDQPFIKRMYEIAVALSANVQGDETERYDSEGRQLN